MITDNVRATTKEQFLPLVIDGVLRSNTFATMMLSKAKSFNGRNLQVPLKVDKSTQGGSFDGLTPFNIVDDQVLKQMEFEAKFVRQPVSISLTDMSRNKGASVVDLVKFKLQSATQDLADIIGDQFYGLGTGTDFQGLEAIVDDGTNTTTYGGLARATYGAAINATVVDSLGVITLAKLSSLYNAINDGSIAPTHIITTPEVFSLVESLFEPKAQYFIEQKKYEMGLVGNAGFTTLMYKGMPIMQDRKCPAETLYMLNFDYLDFYANPIADSQEISVAGKIIKGNDYENAPSMGFSWSDWINIQGASGYTGAIYHGGNLISTDPKRNGKIFGITSAA